MTGSVSDKRQLEVLELASEQLARSLALDIDRFLAFVPSGVLGDCEALSIVLFEEDDRPFGFGLELRITTAAQVEAAIAAGEDEALARWSLDNWLPSTPWEFDSVNARTLDDVTSSWIAAEKAAFGEQSASESRRLHRIRHLVGDIGRRLNETGAVERRFGRNLPLVIRGADDVPWAKELTAHANPWASKAERRRWFL